MYDKRKKKKPMKYILLLTLTLSSLLLASSEVVLGTYSTQKSAATVKAQIDQEIVNDTRFKDFLVKNSIKSVVKENGEYFIVTLGPLNDIVTQHAVLNRVKKTKFKDAYILTIKAHKEDALVDNDPIMKKEPSLDSLTVKTTNKVQQKSVPVQVKAPVQTATFDTPPSTNLLDTYLNEILATIAILLLSIIYLFIKKRQQLDNELPNYNTDNKDNIVQIEDPYAYDSKGDSDSTYEMQVQDEISFNLIDENTKKEEVPADISNTNPLASDVIKRAVPRHEKITKNDFKEFAGSRIMIAEDNIINQKVINGLLADSGINTVTVDDGQEVLDCLEKDSDFCIILMDAHMPNVDGYEATRKIRANPKYSHITVVALSGDTAQDDINNMKKAGMQEHLEKPLKMDPLYDVFSAYTRVQEDLITLDEETEIQESKKLNIDEGLAICSGDEEFYKEILNDFIKNYTNSTKEIQELLNNKKFDDAQRLLLDITGVVTNIGASKLGELVSELRSSLNHPDDKEYIKLFKVYATHYDALELEVKEYL